MKNTITHDRARDALRFIHPVIHPALSDCLTKAVANSSDADGNFDSDKFNDLLKKCIDNVYAESDINVDRVTIGKAAAIAQGLFMAMISQ